MLNILLSQEVEPHSHRLRRTFLGKAMHFNAYSWYDWQHTKKSDYNFLGKCSQVNLSKIYNNIFFLLNIIFIIITQESKIISRI